MKHIYEYTFRSGYATAETRSDVDLSLMAPASVNQRALLEAIDATVESFYAKARHDDRQEALLKAQHALFAAANAYLDAAEHLTFTTTSTMEEKA